MTPNIEVPLLWDHDNGFWMAVCPFCCKMVQLAYDETQCSHWEMTHIADEDDPDDRSFMAFRADAAEGGTN